MAPDEKLDHTPLTFGKHAGKTPDQVSETDPGWLVWAYENVKDKKVCSKALYRACLQDEEHDDDSGPDEPEFR